MRYFTSVLIYFTFMISISYGQSFECDNNFGVCGTPNQSGGGGNGGGGAVLIANTDLGDTYQHADDYDDDGVEDSSDNCFRLSNPDQMDRDADGVGDACDNCLSVWNELQENVDDDMYGDYCDDDIDNDDVNNDDDECPYHYGNSYCLKDLNVHQSHHHNDIFDHTYDNNILEINENIQLNPDSSCTQSSRRILYINFFLLFLITRKLLFTYKLN
jgi:hypothetical protein